MSLKLRPETSEDADFLFELFTQARQADFQHLPLAEPQKTVLIRMQYEAQAASYKAEFPDAEFSIIHDNITDIGRIIINRSNREVRIVDIIIAKDHQRQGKASSCLRALQKDAKRTYCEIKLNVAKTNIPAIHLYKKLGFRQTDNRPPYLSMTWQP